jgi:hypothetical protein
MKMQNLAAFCASSLAVVLSQASAADAQGQTNLPPGTVVTPVVAAQPAPALAKTPTPPAPPTNGVAAPAQAAASALAREITLTDSGCEATFGLHKAFFQSDIGSAVPIKVIGPDTRTLYFRPSFLTLVKRSTDEVHLLGSVTNTIGIAYADSVVWSNAFNTGPRASVFYAYTGNSLEQNILLEESPALPAGWSADDVEIQFWTQLFLGGAAETEDRTTNLRDPAANAGGVDAADSTISFGVMRMVAGGRAFSLGNEQNSLPVAKSLTRLTNEDGTITTWIVERLDYLSAKPSLDALPAAKHASLSKPTRNRSDLLRLQASATRQAENPQSPRFARVKRQPKPMLLARNWHPPKDSFLIDFTIINAIPVPSGIISWWPAGGNALDAITNHNDATVIHGAPTYVAGEVGQGFSFNGTTDFIEVTNSTSLNPTNGITLDCWVYVTGNQNNHRDILSKDGETSNRQFILTDSDQNKFRAHIGVSNVLYFIDATNTVPLNTWTHVAMTYDQTNLVLYVNGIPQTTGAVSGPIMTTTQPFRIGGGAPAGASQYYFAGRIDEPDLFSRALSASEILAIYNAGAAGKYNPNCYAITNANGWWPGDGNTYDLARTNFGAWVGSSNYDSGVVAQAFKFDGSTTDVEIADNPELNPTNALTIEAWIMATGNQNNHRDIFSKDGESSSRQFILTDSSLNKFRAHVGLSGGLSFIDGTNTVPLNTWTHVAMTYDGTNLILYFNGSPEASAALTPGPTITTTQPVRIGGGAPAGQLQYRFAGLIDEATLYNRALSGTEIAAIYSAGCAGKCKVDSDGDGLTDIQEYYFGTNPNSADTDGDGVSDYIEVWQGRNPNAAGALSDTNGLINLKVFTPLR